MSTAPRGTGTISSNLSVTDRAAAILNGMAELRKKLSIIRGRVCPPEPRVDPAAASPSTNHLVAIQDEQQLQVDRMNGAADEILRAL